MKVLIITYYWPPCGGVGVQRWLRFVRYLPDFGYTPTIITTLNGDYPVKDSSLELEVSQNAKVLRTKTPTFGNLYKFFSKSKNDKIPYGSLQTNPGDSLFKKVSTWVRLNLVIPDARIIWNVSAYKAAKKELKKGGYDAVITTGPPHSTHLIGLKLHKQFNLKWIADFRDPWTEMGYLQSVKRLKITKKIDRFFENKVVQDCDQIIAAAHKIISDLNCSADKVHLIPNGFDPKDFANILKNRKSDEFGLNYFGSLPQESTPIAVLQALNILYKDGIRDIKMNFWGNVSNVAKKQLLDLDEFKIIRFHQHVSHQEAIKLMVNSEMLLLMINNVKNNEGIITAKIFEYLGSGVKILGVGPEKSEAAQILKLTKSGTMFDYSKYDKIAKYIKSEYMLWKQGEQKISTEADMFNCAELTKKLVNVIVKN
ncbi:MAG: glycosyltransferase [Candidatus Cloacimonetes bacterium]|nr:glycosyltransferase [Candidatus Cloacimonadota bacterium]